MQLSNDAEFTGIWVGSKYSYLSTYVVEGGIIRKSTVTLRGQQDAMKTVGKNDRKITKISHSFSQVINPRHVEKGLSIKGNKQASKCNWQHLYGLLTVI